MKRPWRLLIEVGGDHDSVSPMSVTAGPAPATAITPGAVDLPQLDREAAWAILTDARGNLNQAIESGQAHDVESINLWIGGGLAVLASLVGEPAEKLLEQLVAETPSNVEFAVVDPDNNVVTNGRANFYSVKRERPAPPKGAPRPLAIEELTDEEREQLGILNYVVPESDTASEEASDETISNEYTM